MLLTLLHAGAATAIAPAAAVPFVALRGDRPGMQVSIAPAAAVPFINQGGNRTLAAPAVATPSPAFPLLLSRFIGFPAPRGAAIQAPPSFNSVYIPTISGVTRDNFGNPLGNCTVKLFRTNDDIRLDQVVSDGNGNFTFNVSNPAGTFWIRVDDPTKTLAGASLQNLIAS